MPSEDYILLIGYLFENRLPQGSDVSHMVTQGVTAYHKLDPLARQMFMKRPLNITEQELNSLVDASNATEDFTDCTSEGLFRWMEDNLFVDGNPAFHLSSEKVFTPDREFNPLWGLVLISSSSPKEHIRALVEWTAAIGEGGWYLKNHRLIPTLISDRNTFRHFWINGPDMKDREPLLSFVEKELFPRASESERQMMIDVMNDGGVSDYVYDSDKHLIYDDSIIVY